MNKQEVLEELETTSTQFFHVATSTGVEANNKTLSTGVFAGLGIAKSVLTKLEEPQKVKIPEFVAYWIETAKKEKRSLHYSMQDIDDACYYHKGDDPLYQWMFVCDDSSEHQEMFARAYINGYEVEEELKYRVLFPCDKRKTGHQFSYLMEDGRQCYCSDLETIPELTESTIKSIDERYWPFAVPVEKV